MELKIFTGFKILTLLYLVTFCRGNNENGIVCPEISSNVSKKNYETLMETLQIIFGERKSCKCLEERVKDLKKELQMTKIKFSTTIPKTSIKTTRKVLTTKEPPTTIAESIPKDCFDIYSTGERKNGKYTISPNGILSFPVFCDLQDGGWVVIQRRMDDTVNFDRVWEDYAQGFGNLSADFWLGLRNLHLLTMELSEISFEMVITKSGRNAFAVYKNFTIENESNFFRMHVGRDAIYNTEMMSYITDNNGFYYHNNMKFSTKDSDNDKKSGNCAKTTSGGYWYNDCYLFGNFNADNITGMRIYDGSYIQISRSVIKIRRMS